MKIRDILGQGRPTISFEVFPPKTAENYEAVKEAALEIAALKRRAKRSNFRPSLLSCLLSVLR